MPFFRQLTCNVLQNTYNGARWREQVVSSGRICHFVNIKLKRFRYDFHYCHCILVPRVFWKVPATEVAATTTIKGLLTNQMRLTYPINQSHEIRRFRSWRRLLLLLEQPFVYNYTVWCITRKVCGFAESRTATSLFQHTLPGLPSRHGKVRSCKQPHKITTLSSRKWRQWKVN
jgi:hypothetical protein